MLVGHQAKTVEIVGGGDDVDGESWRICVQVVGMNRQFTAIVMNRHPPSVNQHKGEAGNESVHQVGTKDFRSICFKAVHPVVPAFFGQVIAYKYWQIFIQRVHIGDKGTNIFTKLYRIRQLLYCFRFGFVGKTVYLCRRNNNK